MTGTHWTAERREELRALWLQEAPRLSTAKIAAAMGLTKNMVVGQAHRMRLPGRPSPIVPGGATQARPTKPAPRLPPAPVQLATAGGALPPSVTPQPGEAPAVAPRPSLPPRVTTHARRCRYPLWGKDERPTHRYCDAPSVPGCSWCAAHRAICTSEPKHWAKRNLAA